jgi:Mlc titration factor MtfA (ptsG expression regulator)
MLVTPEIDYHNRRYALLAAGIVGLAAALVGFFVHLAGLLGLLLVPLAWWIIRRPVLRRAALMREVFPPAWEAILEKYVGFYRALDDPQRLRFRQMVRIFLDEIRITGINAEVDETVRVLVGASAVIPIFGFHDWDYDRLGEVLIFPGSFNMQYKATGGRDANTLGLVGLGHLSGVMILSKPDLLHGYAVPDDKQNVGIHEFTHVVEDEEGRLGLPPEVPEAVVRQWLAYVGRELSRPSRNKKHIDAYAYTNEHEFLAVLSEYFFEAPEALQKKAPQLYDMLRAMFHQDPASLYKHLPLVKSRKKVGRNDLCPCGSGKKFKHCCLAKQQAADVKSQQDRAPAS